MVLGIENRTENWKTALYFSPLFGEGGGVGRAKLATRLLGGISESELGDVHLELYWKGMRDYMHQKGQKREDYKHDLAARYGRLFPDLRKEIEDFGQHRDLKSSNYKVSSETLDKFSRNLINTEIDIVLESQGHLFIGEAKHEMGFGGDSSLILVHQLIRQYVMAKILVDRLELDKEIIPFVVGDCAADLKRTFQVNFMIQRGRMEEENVLEWNDVAALGS